MGTIVKGSMFVAVVLLASLQLVVSSELPPCGAYPATGEGCSCGSTVCVEGQNCAWRASKGFFCKVYDLPRFRRDAAIACEDAQPANCTAWEPRFCASAYYTTEQKRKLCANTCGLC